MGTEQWWCNCQWSKSAKQTWRSNGGPTNLLGRHRQAKHRAFDLFGLCPLCDPRCRAHDPWLLGGFIAMQLYIHNKIFYKYIHAYNVHIYIYPFALKDMSTCRDFGRRVDFLGLSCAMHILGTCLPLSYLMLFLFNSSSTHETRINHAQCEKKSNNILSLPFVRGRECLIDVVSRLTDCKCRRSWKPICSWAWKPSACRGDYLGITMRE